MPHPSAVRGAAAAAARLARAARATRVGPRTRPASGVRPAAAAALLSALRTAACLWQVLRVGVGARQHLEGAGLLRAHRQGHHAHLGGPPVPDHHEGETEHQGIPVTGPHHQRSPASHCHRAVLRRVGAGQRPGSHAMLLPSEHLLQKGVEGLQDPPPAAAQHPGLPRRVLHDPHVGSGGPLHLPGQQ